MHAALSLASWKQRRDLIGRRATGVVLAVFVHILGLLLLISLTPELRVSKPDMKNFTLLSLSDQPAAKPAPRNRLAKATPRKTSPPPPALPPPSVSPLKMILVSSDVFKASDISTMHAHPDQQAASGDSAPGATEEAGGGPHGERLYNAEWYVEPTPAEMAYYLPAGRPQAGWGLIMCRTIQDYHVDDCRELGESPTGSGLSRALRQAAWQFRVRPPRTGGRPMVGAWVRILFDFKQGVVK